VGEQTYQAVHIDGTHHVVDACKAAGVPKLSITSFLRARPDCGSAYHESKFAAEELVRESGLVYTVFKPGVIYGKGDHLLDHLSHAFHTFPVFAFVGMKDQMVRPLAVEDFALAVTGPEELTLSAAVKRVANAVGKHPLYYFRAPLWFHYALAWVCEATMKVPLISLGQVRILSEGITDPCGDYELPPIHLRPNTPFMESFIRTQLPEPRRFGFRDLRLANALG
jgi:nucleoside-diphosphate-sugar epimerase